jgi:glucan-binding YG repeat protein
MNLTQMISRLTLTGIGVLTVAIIFMNIPFHTVSANGTSINENNIIIEDPKLLSAIKHQLNLQDGDLTLTDLSQLTELKGSGLGIQSLSGIEEAKNLEKIDLSNNQILDIEPLNSISHLKQLNLIGNPLNQASKDNIFSMLDQNIEVNYFDGWELHNGQWYYLNPEGKSTGWIQDQGTWYFFNLKGIMKIGWIYDNNNWYFLGFNGTMMTGWLKDNNRWYFLNSDGSMRTGWLWYKQNWYFMNSSGAMDTGWKNIKGSWYFFSSDGKMLNGWQKISGDWYYLQSNGYMLTGWKKDGDYWYFLKPDGKMAVGWFQNGSNWYYTYKSGALVQNTMVDNYYLGYSGVWIKHTTHPYYINGVLLVNKNHSVSSSYTPGESLDARNAFNQMKNAALKSGLSLNAFSTYRTYEYQETLFNRYVRNYGETAANKFSAKAGQSEHQTGLAFDIGGSNSALWAEDTFAYIPEAKWLASNAHRYGFILRYPKGKEHITGYQYESWHFRYVGVNVAANIYNKSQTLEEYLGEY